MTPNQHNKAPHWVQDNSLIQRILNKFIDRVDAGEQLKMFVNQTQTPELYDFDNCDTESLWRLVVEQLEHATGIVEIRLQSKLALHDLPYNKARLTFNAKHEELVRQWLNRPAELSYRQAWKLALDNASDALPNPDAFRDFAIQLKGRSAAQAIEGFVNVTKELAQLELTQSSISLRTLSARCFAGDSKVLDDRRPFLEHAFPGASDRIQARAIMMSVYIPSDIEVALFIENFDSFRSTVAAIQKTEFKHRVAIIYSAGFRGSAERIRQIGNAQFVVINHSDAQAYKRFEDWWYCENNNSVSCYFWGDLDFSGMAIIKTLRVKFTNMQAWQAAYARTVHYHQLGARHLAKNAKKEQQKDPVSTGCDYADQQLLPLMRNSQAFTDQEVVGEAEIVDAINLLFSNIAS